MLFRKQFFRGKRIWCRKYPSLPEAALNGGWIAAVYEFFAASWVSWVRKFTCSMTLISRWRCLRAQFGWIIWWLTFFAYPMPFGQRLGVRCTICSRWEPVTGNNVLRISVLVIRFCHLLKHKKKTWYFSSFLDTLGYLQPANVLRESLRSGGED